MLKSSRPTAIHRPPFSRGSCSKTVGRPAGSSAETISPAGL